MPGSLCAYVPQYEGLKLSIGRPGPSFCGFIDAIRGRAAVSPAKRRPLPPPFVRGTILALTSHRGRELRPHGQQVRFMKDAERRKYGGARATGGGNSTLSPWDQSFCEAGSGSVFPLHLAGPDGCDALPLPGVAIHPDPLPPFPPGMAFDISSHPSASRKAGGGARRDPTGNFAGGILLNRPEI
jgi:hypothetical protein